MRGRTKTPEHREKIRQSRLGYKHTPEAIARMTIKRRARPRLTDEVILEQCRQIVRRRHEAVTQERTDQWRQDQLAAYGRPALFADIKQSGGWAHKRTRHDASGRASDGMTGDGEILWFDREWGKNRNAQSTAWWKNHRDKLIKEH